MRKQKKAAKKTISTVNDKDDRFIVKKAATYLYRHMKRHPSIIRTAMPMICWTLNQERNRIVEYLMFHLNKNQKKELLCDIAGIHMDDDDRSNACFNALQNLDAKQNENFLNYIFNLLEHEIDLCETHGTSDIEKNISSLKQIFSLTENEVEFCVFLFIVSAYDAAEDFFVNSLKCNKVRGFKYLTNILQITKNELNKILTGTIDKIGMIETDDFNMRMDRDFVYLFLNPENQAFSERFYTPITARPHLIQNYFMSETQKDHIIRLLKLKPKTSTHILFYGPPGTGKSSFAYSLIKHLGISGYEIVRGKENTTKDRRAAIVACLNMTNTGKGSIVLVDEADNILNTKYSWFARGETQDKGWLNQLLEKSGSRVIWVTNNIDDIEDSVLRRFAYSIYFKPFNRCQRVQLWNNVLSQNKCKRLLSTPEIEQLAIQFNVSAGVIDLAVKKAKEMGHNSKNDFHESVIMALSAHLTLLNSGIEPVNKDLIEKNYSLDGLNIKGDLAAIIEQLDKFDQFLRHTDHEKILNMNLLFYGQPGTGKSELARYIAMRLDREIICRRVSDIQSMWVGETEKNIKKAFQQAESEEAILIFDEADSLIFTRDRALRSWEISFTNEFLTQMERFRGILICTTNRNRDLDEASVRRFNHKIEFNYLTGDGNIIFYEKLLQGLVKTPLDVNIRKSLRQIANLAPGDFKTIRDRYSFYPPENVNHQIMINALKEEAGIKNKYLGSARIGF